VVVCQRQRCSPFKYLNGFLINEVCATAFVSTDWTSIDMGFLVLGLIALVMMDNCYSTAKSALGVPQRSVSLLTDEERCYNFSIGDPYKKEFYSPGYPAKYPAKADCILTLKADYGQIIRVDFRDHFDIEPHKDCDYDYLEIRDGAHGYSPVLARYCGPNYPPVITSSESHIWMRFRSDDTIEYAGFRAVYQFLPDISHKRPYQGACSFEMSGLDGSFGSKDIPDEILNYTISYGVPLDCTWVITVDRSQKIQLSFPQYGLAKPNECDMNFIEIFGEKTDLQHRIRQFCGSVIEVVVSKTNVLHLRFFAEASAMKKSSFNALFTAVTPYRELEGDAKCLPSEFDCEDAVCIDLSLRCNGRVNCRFRYDEDNCKVEVKKPMSSSSIVIILTVFCLTLFGMCFSCIYNCVRKLKADHHDYQTRRSRSREDRLDVLDATPPRLTGPQKRLLSSKGGASNGAVSIVEGSDEVFQHRSRVPTSTSRSLSSPVDHPHHTIVGLERHVSVKDDDIDDDRGDIDEEDDDDDEEEGEEESSDEETVEMVDHACQTRESLFNNEPIRPSIPPRLPTGPPPPSSSFKAEKRIEIAPKVASSRSSASSKSGPDLVVLQ